MGPQSSALPFGSKPGASSNHARSPSTVQSMLGGSLPPSLQVPPRPTSIYDTLWISSNESGLYVRSVRWKYDAVKGGIKIGWGLKGKVEVLEEGELQSGGEEAEVKGLVGIVRLWNAGYLLVIVESKQAGSFPSSVHPIYKIGNVQAIPLVPTEAQEAIRKLCSFVSHVRSRDAPADSRASIEENAARSDWLRSGEVQTPGPEREENQTESEEETTAKSNAPGLFNWNPFIKGSSAVSSAIPSRTTSPGPRRPADEPTQAPSEFSAPSISQSGPSLTPASSTSASRSQLESKVVLSIASQFASGQMFFSYDVDLTTNLNAKQAKLGGFEGREEDLIEPSLHLPLWRRVERRFWWNEWLSREFVDAGLHAYVLPIMQGWVQTATLHFPRSINTLTSKSESTSSSSSSSSSEEDENDDDTESKKISGKMPVRLTVISRRSRDRAGLRYQRRGIDDEGDVANFVETEQIVQAEGRTFSFTQIRGSIPLFWSQSPYSASALALKPAPMLDRPVEDSKGPMTVHFDTLNKHYGPQAIVSLSELTGKEAVVTNGYRDLLASLGRDDVQYTQFDFHHECRGMKFENVSKLVHQLDRTFANQGYFELGPLSKTQKGTFRTNCIDCLDRTNVVQSAFARSVLTTQLASVGLTNLSALPRSTLETVFNDIWANNGDAISKAYAGTSALKGDFTRTGKRDFHGMINDGLNSLARMYSSSFTDFFAQAIISFMLGQRSISIFTEFSEKLQVSEPSNLLRLSIIRAEAIETCTARVLNEGETRQAGWTLFSPVEQSRTISPSFEEKVLLLTEQALYVCSYEFQLEKVVSFTRIPLATVLGLQRGEYILSPLQESGKDPEENYGFKIIYEDTDESTTRLTSYSLTNKISSSSHSQYDSSSPSVSNPANSSTTQKRRSLLKPFSFSKSSAENAPVPSTTTVPIPPSKFFAFKAIPRDILLHKRNRPDLTYTLPVGGTEDDEGLNDGQTCREFIEGAVSKIKVACSEAGSGSDGLLGPGKKFIEEESIVSLAQAEKQTSWSDRVEYGIKRFLWLY
ncbi:Phosphoinositide phosphatase SAC1 [Phaffia rhodozyma]|uniref:Phosphoinositide phosphatase SAC1 n=1 Tax=Phaffia rhodozyma TaxID=264483 RepID=A0A0F7SKH9_PHARH|nr:Phosphoinositide phosphatase SAC1 [Phaffia rhodozyma]